MKICRFLACDTLSGFTAGAIVPGISQNIERSAIKSEADMCNNGTIYQEDINSILNDRAIPWENLDGKTVVVTGATGLIGRTLVHALLSFGQSEKSSVNVTILVRNVEKARNMFAQWLDRSANFHIVQWDITDAPAVDGPVDYIIHCASQTSSKGFVEQPVETIATSYLGTERMLHLARQKNVRGFVYLSTMEVYGTPQTDEKITENYSGKIDSMKVRNCYPESKRLCENLCVAYASEYQVPTCVARLTQTFGPGIQPDDNRVFAEFARCVMTQRDIILHTKGETKRNYVYIADAVRAILLILLRGQSGEAYNVANEETYCTIYEMAKMVADEIAHGQIQVKCELEQDAEKMGYAPVLHMNLDTTKLCALGWRPSRNLEEMFRRMIADFMGT